MSGYQFFVNFHPQKKILFMLRQIILLFISLSETLVTVNPT